MQLVPSATALAFGLVLALAASPAALAQGGYTAETHAELGISLPRARDYEQVPTQPDEDYVVLYYTCKDKKEFTGLPPSLSVVWIDWLPEAARKPDQVGPVAPVNPEGETSAPKPGAEKVEPPPVINTLERYLAQRTVWSAAAAQPGKDRDGYKATIHVLDLQKEARKRPDLQRHVAWCYAFTQEQRRTIAFVGECLEPDLEQHAKIWRYVAEHAKFSEPQQQDLDQLRAKYASAKLRGVDHRVEVRSSMVRGWKAEDTTNFIVTYHTKDQPLLRKLLADLEAIHEKYVELFPPVSEITAVSTVRVCKDRAEYLAYGGWPGTAGYWNSQTEELVFFDAAADNKRERAEGREDTLSVLYHEAFHQYIHYSCGELPPHSWFGEGFGDFFAGARISAGKVKKIDVFDWRVATIKRAVAENKHVPWSAIIRFEQPDYYRPDRVHICYAQGWSMIYFLRTSPKARKHAQWSKILDTYFVELKADYGRRLEELKTNGMAEDEKSRAEAGVQAREHAVDRAFTDVDLSELEADWRKFVLELDFKD